MIDRHQLIWKPVGLQLLICLHILACCVSLIFVSKFYPTYHIYFQAAGLSGLIAIIAAFALVSVVFVYAEFSFGYLVGFHLYTMVIGYLWLNWFSEFNYDHRLSGFSAAASAIAFLVPALFIRSPLPQVWIPSPRTFDRCLDLILLVGALTVAIGATYNFKPVALGNDVYIFRGTLNFPTALNYLLGITSNALLPFAFACFIERNSLGRAAVVLILLLLFYPITLNKLALFSSAWIASMALLSRILDIRIAVILPLLLLLVVGIVAATLYLGGAIPENAAIPYFWLINFRMLTIPSMAMDYYNDFFSRNDLTYFCQIRLLKPLIACPYQEQLGLAIYREFGIGGNFNASLFATEGIASVGALWAPVAVFACGLVIAIGNRLSAGLPARFVFISAAIFPQILLNVPLTVTLLTNGVAFLFLLWYITPRTIFEPSASRAVDKAKSTSAA